MFVGFIGAVVTLLATLPSLVTLWSEARVVPDAPMNVRLNPFNILAYPQLWTPAIRRAHGRLVMLGLCFVVCALLVLAAALAA